MRAWMVFFVLTTAACGPAPPPADEVTETWTSGDDAPLEALEE